MAEQSNEITTGELSASIGGSDEFKAQELEFIGSEDESDFVLRVADGKRVLIFYFSTFESAIHNVGLDGDIKAFYHSEGVLYEAFEDGVIEVKVDHKKAVDIVFNIVMKNNSDGDPIQIKGRGHFEGRVAWEEKHRAFFINPLRNEVLWDGPNILQPKPGTLSPGFSIVGGTGIAHPDEWELEILVGPNVILRYRGQYGRVFSYDVPANLLPLGTPFYFRLDYYIFPLWSRWTYSGDLQITPFGDPQILDPVDHDFVTTDTPEVSGTGHKGANVVVKDVGNTTVFGTATVDSDGNWKTKLHPVPSFPLAVYAKQTLRQDVSDWSNIVHINRSYPELKRPVISKPTQGAKIRWNELEISGGNCSEGAKVTLYRSGSGVVDHGSAKVGPDGTWTIKPVQLYLGPYLLTVQQSLEGRVSEYAEDLKVTLTL